MSLLVLAGTMLLLRGLKAQGRLGRSFGKVTIRDQPPSNTLQKIIGLKEAMASMENHLQNLNVTLLKLRTIFLAGQPEVYVYTLKDFTFCVCTSTNGTRLYHSTQLQ
jgi:Plant protein of unknown function (DUF639)